MDKSFFVITFSQSIFVLIPNSKKKIYSPCLLSWAEENVKASMDSMDTLRLKASIILESYLDSLTRMAFLIFRKAWIKAWLASFLSKS